MNFDSENRDNSLNKRNFESQVKLKRVIDALTEEEVQRLAAANPRSLGDAQPPTPEASAYAMKLLLDAESTIAHQLGTDTVPSTLNKGTGAPYLYSSPTKLEPGEQHTGVLPLVHLCCEDLALAIYYPRFAHDAVGFPRAQIAATLSQALIAENELWVYRAGQARIPYPFVYWALQHIRKAEAAPGHASLCVRCGELITYYVRKHTRTALRCPRCAQESRAAREWPSHAVMPHTRAKWLLKCQAGGCMEIFAGSRLALYCKPHRAARISPDKRAAFRP